MRKRAAWRGAGRDTAYPLRGSEIGRPGSVTRQMSPQVKLSLMNYIDRFSILANIKGPINNRSLVITRQGGQTLRGNIDHYKFGERIWSFYLSLYGGGPQVTVSSEGGVRVSSPAPVSDKVRSLRSEEMQLED